MVGENGYPITPDWQLVTKDDAASTLRQIARPTLPLTWHPDGDQA